KGSDKLNQVFDDESISTRWRGLYKAGGIVAIILLILTVAQMVVFLASPPPSTVEGFFTLFQTNWLRGLLSLDLIYIIINALLILLYLVLYIVLKRTNEFAITVALILGLVGIAAYFSSNTSFQMLSLSNHFTTAATDAQRSVYLGAGEALLATYSGTAFDVYYILNAITLLIFSIVMLKSDIFSRAMAYLGIAAGLLMLIPSTAGTVGIYFSLVSLIPWIVFLILFTRRVLWLDSHLT
ncbi:MAG: DUF4386 family protein, partial [Dehalococcoidales bacterium]|nr:DUF4386 family protein [Dehalococcoidales bacterium]